MEIFEMSLSPENRALIEREKVGLTIVRHDTTTAFIRLEDLDRLLSAARAEGRQPPLAVTIHSNSSGSTGQIAWQIGGTVGGMRGGEGEFIVPAGITEMVVTCIGGGQGACALRGGDSGEATPPTRLRVQPGERIPWKVGRGGAMNEDGEDTTFGSLIARGGGRHTPTAGPR